MITKQNCYDILILLTFVSFAIFGSLSHLFTLGLILLVLSANLTTKNRLDFDAKAITLYFALAGCFFIFALRSIYDDNLLGSLEQLSPMLSIPLIGLLLVFHEKKSLKLNSKRISKYSQISVSITLIVYTILFIFGPHANFHQYIAGRVELFSGNPIPFSYVMLGVSVFCLTDWWNSGLKNRIIAFFFLLVGLLFAGFLSGTRGTLLSIIIIFPFLLYYLSKSLKLTLVFSIVLILFGFLFIQMEVVISGKSSYASLIYAGLETLTMSSMADYSATQRLEMWSASIQAISNGPWFGYGATERFNAIRPYLPNSFQALFSHPHNDILASTNSIGYLGGVTALISLISAFLASLISNKVSHDKILLSLMLTIPTLITANLSTVFFNDISAGWLAFSTYLVWVVDFGEKQNVRKMAGSQNF